MGGGVMVKSDRVPKRARVM